VPDEDGSIAAKASDLREVSAQILPRTEDGVRRLVANPLVTVAPGVGLEPTTYGLTVRRSAG
jgi:hypothetical protein